MFWDAAAPARPTEGIEEFLEFLFENRIRTGVISNISFSGKAVRDRIAQVVPENHFEFILATSEYMYRKPNKRIFDLALEKAGLMPEEVWYVGDQYECDIVGARNAGIFPVWYLGALDLPYEETEGVMAVADWKRLREILGKILRGEGFGGISF